MEQSISTLKIQLDVVVSRNGNYDVRQTTLKHSKWRYLAANR